MKKKLLLFFLFVSGSLLLSLKPAQKEITIFLAGDSTVADKPFRSGNPEKGWGQLLPLYFKLGVRVENHAVNGRSTKSFIDEGRWDSLISKVQIGDYVLIEFGHNDQKAEDPKRYAPAESDFSNNLRRFISDVQKKQAIPILATPIARRRFNEEGQFYDTHGTYPDAVRKVAEETGVILIDLHQASCDMVERFGFEKSKLLYLHIDTLEYDHLKKPIVDDTHLSPYGGFKICDMVVAQLRLRAPLVAAYLKE